MPPFHLAFSVTDLSQAEHFYAGLLQCAVGRRSERWIDFNFFGHQITAHLSPETNVSAPVNGVDGDAVPIRHFGVVLKGRDWHALKDRLEQAGTDFLIAPKLRFEGKAGEQGTFFLTDPSGNALEFKTFADMDRLFDPGLEPHA